MVYNISYLIGRIIGYAIVAFIIYLLYKGIRHLFRMRK